FHRWWELSLRPQRPIVPSVVQEHYANLKFFDKDKVYVRGREGTRQYEPEGGQAQSFLSKSKVEATNLKDYTTFRVATRRLVLEFEHICSTITHTGVSAETVKLLLIPFTIDGQEKAWLEALPPDTITIWTDFVQLFLRRVLPIAQELKDAKLAKSKPKEQTYHNLELATVDFVENSEKESEEEGLDDVEQENKEIMLQLDWRRKSRGQTK
ncbi:hypothetical protein Goari_020487, partial [Gossypium aridum]|nr:hypothetical protein [Gossypium aridum]